MENTYRTVGQLVEASPFLQYWDGEASKQKNPTTDKYIKHNNRFLTAYKLHGEDSDINITLLNALENNARDEYLKVMEHGVTLKQYPFVIQAQHVKGLPEITVYNMVTGHTEHHRLTKIAINEIALSSPNKFLQKVAHKIYMLLERNK